MAGTVTLEWLGQAGFIARGSSAAVAFDPYLSDQCLHEHGLVRQMLAPSTPRGLGADVVLISHWHPDHLDLDSAAEFVASGAVIIAPRSCIDRITGRGIPADKLVPIESGQTVQQRGVAITAVPALHQVPGAITEDAVGFVVELDDVRLFHSGDSEYDRRILAAGLRGPVDVAMLCMNGTGGNMNVWEAAMLAAQLHPRLAVPMHWGMWDRSGYGPDATLDPTEFARIYSRLTPGAETRIPDLAVPIDLR